MRKYEADNKPDKKAAQDLGEGIGLMEPLVLVSDGSRAPLRLAFPAALASRWMPGLFPEQRG